jgi:opine dehydrogenase
MKVLLCGGGNAIHVLTSYIGSLPDCEVCILSLFPGEAERFKTALDAEKGIRCENDMGLDPVYGKPAMISSDPAAVVPGSDVVILALPSFTHNAYLDALKPHLKPGVVIGSMPGQSGFDLCARSVLGSDFVDASSTIFALETLPWACRIVKYGQEVQVLGTKKEIGAVIVPREGQSIEQVLGILQTLVGPTPILKASSNFLAVTLMNPNTVHPTISYGFYRNKDLTVPFDEAPVFYQGVDERTGEMLSQVSDEVMRLRDVLVEQYPTLDLSSMLHIRDVLLRYYSDKLGDKTNVYTMLKTSEAHRGLVHPMREIMDTPPNGNKKYLPDFKSRYFTEGTCAWWQIPETK